MIFDYSGGNVVGVTGGGNTLVVNPSPSVVGSVTSNVGGLNTTAASFAAINRKMQNVAQVTVSQIPAVSLLIIVRIHIVCQCNGLTIFATQL